MEEICDVVKNAIMEGDIARLKAEIEKIEGLGALPVTEQGSTPLMVAAAYGQLEIVKYLVKDVGVDINGRNINGTTALVFACNMKQPTVVHYLCENGAYVDSVIDSGDTPLTISAAAGHCDVVACLCLHSANLEWRNGEGQTALHCACIEGHIDVVMVLLDNNANIDALTGADMGELCCTPLVYACKHGHIDIAGYLIGRGADHSIISESLMQHLDPQTKIALIHLLTSAGWAPILDFRRACELNDKGNFLRLVGAYPSLEEFLSVKSLPSAGGANAIALASLHGSLDVLQCITDMAISRPPQHPVAIDMQATTSDGRTALFYAAWSGRTDTVKYLVDTCRFDVNTLNSEGNSPLYFACMNGHRDTVTYLLGAGSSTRGVTEEIICANLYKIRPSDINIINALKSELWNMVLEYAVQG